MGSKTKNYELIIKKPYWFNLLLILGLVLNIIMLCLMITGVVIAAQSLSKVKQELATENVQAMIRHAIPQQYIEDVINDALTSFVSSYMTAMSGPYKRSNPSQECACLKDAMIPTCDRFRTCTATRNVTLCSAFGSDMSLICARK
jgi:hypothetical protein